MLEIPRYQMLVYIDEGEGKLELDSTAVRTTEGELYIVPCSGQGVSAIVDQQGKQSLRALCRLIDAESLGMAAPLLPMKWSVYQRYRGEMRQLLRSMPALSPGSLNISESEWAPLWSQFMAFLLSQPFKASLQTVGYDELPIRQALHFIGHRFMTPISVAETSRLVAMSSRHFQRMFKSITGRTFIQMLQEVRIRHSCGLLQFSRLSVQTVAEYVGIYDMNYFYRLFRSYCDMTPAAFRQHYQLPGASWKWRVST